MLLANTTLDGFDPTNGLGNGLERALDVFLLAAKSVKDARVAKEQQVLNKANRSQLQTAKDKMGELAQKRLELIGQRDKLKTVMKTFARPEQMPRLQQKLQIFELHLASLEHELQAQERNVQSLDHRLMQGDVAYRAEKVLAHLQNGPEIARGKARVYLQQVLGFKEPEIEDLRQAPRGISVPLLSARMA